MKIKCNARDQQTFCESFFISFRFVLFRKVIEQEISFMTASRLANDKKETTQWCFELHVVFNSLVCHSTFVEFLFLSLSVSLDWVANQFICELTTPTLPWLNDLLSQFFFLVVSDKSRAARQLRFTQLRFTVYPKSIKCINDIFIFTAFH